MGDGRAVSFWAGFDRFKRLRQILGHRWQSCEQGKLLTEQEPALQPFLDWVLACGGSIAHGMTVACQTYAAQAFEGRPPCAVPATAATGLDASTPALLPPLCLQPLRSLCLLAPAILAPRAQGTLACRTS